MKKLLNIIPLLLVILFSSCEDHENKVYSGNVDNFTFLSFDQSAYRLDIAIDAEGTLTIPLKSSALSSVDRVYNIELLADQSVADPLTYSLPATVTIPANEYFGNIVITGQDLGLVEAAAKVFVFKISDLAENEFMDNDTVTVSVAEVCPLFMPFTGQYKVENVVSSSFWGPINPNGSIVNVISTSEFGRRVEFNNFLISGFKIDFRFTLGCGEVAVSPLNTTIWCGSGNYYSLGDGATPGSYDPNDDSEITIVYTENTNSACGAGPSQATFKLIKI